ncbi:hypothetical protein JK628_23215 (plasmid) [Shewanella sp. KX20019]|uniref:hypothetical protein n=1 Tax=Shewanella sp. KX20019 TaxID=2803864 RepID=UPI0019284635|nr:hypothetical protein [Shewanella sp. KX20019]QQX82694.1 hypothetical protein JK628_23215 [Shewanella sp. KX20019]
MKNRAILIIVFIIILAGPSLIIYKGITDQERNKNKFDSMVADGCQPISRSPDYKEFELLCDGVKVIHETWF